MTKKLVSKDNLLEKLRAYTETPDDENIQYKEKIKNALLLIPELLYALNNKELESELFDDDGNINWDPETHEAYGEWDRYFGDTSNIRPSLFIPDTQTEAKNYVCYQVGFAESPRYNDIQKYTEITFSIFCHELDRTDRLTGIPRHDLIASIIRERFNMSNTFGMKARLISSRESTTDTHYVVRTLVFRIVDTNGYYTTPYGGKTSVNNYNLRK